MASRINLFTESVEKLGISNPTLEALANLAKVFLENALYDEENEEYSTDTAEYDLSEDDVYTDEDEPPSVDIAGDVPDDMVDSYDYGDRMASGRDGLRIDGNQDVDAESSVGTLLATAYMRLAPKLVDANICKMGDVDTLAKFVDWIINKFQTLNPSLFMERAANNYKSRKKYDTSRMDKLLNVVSMGQSVIQLLKEIKAEFGGELGRASLLNESAILSAAKDINAFVSNKFSVIDRDGVFDADQTEDKNIIATNRGFIDTQNIGEEYDDNPAEQSAQQRMAAEPNQAKAYAKNVRNARADSQGDHFSEDSDIDMVNSAVDDFVNLVPTADLPDEDAAQFNSPVSKKKKAVAKKAAERRDAFRKAHKGNVIETSVLDDEYDPWSAM